MSTAESPVPVHPAALPQVQLLQFCRFEQGRRGGPGGQHRNKVQTAVIWHHLPSGLQASASERREQARNRQVALFRLRVKLALQLRGYFRIEDGPSELWRSRCRAGRLSISPEHTDFPSLLAELLDTLEHCDDDMAPAAAYLGLTNSQVVRVLKLEPEALQAVNAQRAQRGLHPLR